MLKRTFLFLERIGYRREKKLWQQGISNWEDFLNKQKIKGISRKYKKIYDKELELAYFHLKNRIPYYFSYRMRKADYWRLYRDFEKEACYIDIETNLSGDITLVTIYDGRRTKTYVKDINLKPWEVREEISRYKFVVTFFGSVFDVPYLRYKLGVNSKIPNFDLCFAFRRLGLRGGLKEIEKAIGVNRDEEIEGLRGSDALALWEGWVREGDEGALELLVRYNQADAVNLKPLAEYAYEKLRDLILFQSSSVKYV